MVNQHWLPLVKNKKLTMMPLLKLTTHTNGLKIKMLRMLLN